MYRLIIAITSAGVLGTEEDLDAIVGHPTWKADWNTLENPRHRVKVIEHGRATRAKLQTQKKTAPEGAA